MPTSGCYSRWPLSGRFWPRRKILAYPLFATFDCLWPPFLLLFPTSGHLLLLLTALAAFCCVGPLEPAEHALDRPPRPMLTKKLMAKRVFFGLSFGNSPSKLSSRLLSCSRSLAPPPSPVPPKRPSCYSSNIPTKWKLCANPRIKISLSATHVPRFADPRPWGTSCLHPR